MNGGKYHHVPYHFGAEGDIKGSRTNMRLLDRMPSFPSFVALRSNRIHGHDETSLNPSSTNVVFTKSFIDFFDNSPKIMQMVNVTLLNLAMGNKDNAMRLSVLDLEPGHQVNMIEITVQIDNICNFLKAKWGVILGKTTCTILGNSLTVMLHVSILATDEGFMITPTSASAKNTKLVKTALYMLETIGFFPYVIPKSSIVGESDVVVRTT